MYYVYKLDFKDNFVHFGDNDLSDSKFTIDSKTLFSAIINEGISLYGEVFLEEIFSQIGQDNFRISNLLPYIDTELFIPKPIISKDELGAVEIKENSYNPKKDLKKINYIGISKFSDYISILKKSDFDENTFREYKELSFGVSSSFTKNKIGDEKTEPFEVGVYKFHSNSGLYFILKCYDNSFIEKFNSVIKSLGITGIGGKRSVGYGVFEYNCLEVKEGDYIYKYLENNEKHNMLISSCIPMENEIAVLSKKGSYYTLSLKSGFKYSVSDYSNTNKKKGIVYIDVGSILEEKILGQIKDSKREVDKHSIYNYGLSLFISF